MGRGQREFAEGLQHQPRLSAHQKNSSNRDQPEAVLVHLSDDSLLGEPGVRLAIATDLYRSGSISLGRAAKVAGMALAEFMQEMGRAGIPIIRGNAKTLRQDIGNLEAWLKKGSSSAMRAR